MGRSDVVEAIRASWSRRSSAEPDKWTSDNPAKGQCEVSSFVFWEHVGGDLVLAKVLIDGEMSEYHYWNRVDGHDIDLTASQFDGTEEIVELSVLTSEEIDRRKSGMRPELAARIDALRSGVAQRLTSLGGGR